MLHIRSGYMAVVTLPDDQQFVIADASRSKGRIDPHVRGRLVFYFATAVLNEKSRRDGIEIAVLVSPDGILSNDRYLELMKVLHVSLPMYIRNLTTVPVPPREGTELLVEYMAILIARTHESLSQGRVNPSQIAASTEEALQRLEARGIQRSYLPERSEDLRILRTNLRIGFVCASAW